MATEVTVKICNTLFSHALFINEEQWAVNLEELRNLMTSQKLEIPHDYKFLSGSGNVISTALEPTLTLRDLVKTKKSEQESTTSDVKEETSDGNSKPPKSAFHISILPTELLSQADDDKAAEKSRQNQPQGCPLCPFTVLKAMFPHLQDTLTSRKLLKILLLLTLLMTIAIAALVCTVHTVAFVIGGLTSQSVFSDMFFKSGMLENDLSTMMDLKVKLSELETSTKFELKDLKRKLTELEDLYLRDLEVQRKELASMKTKQAEVENMVSRDMQSLAAKLDNVTTMITRLAEGQARDDEQRHKEKQKGKGGKESHQEKRRGKWKDKVDGEENDDS